MRRWAVLVVIAVVIGVWVARDKRQREEQRQARTDERNEAAIDARPAPDAFVAIEPTIISETLLNGAGSFGVNGSDYPPMFGGLSRDFRLDAEASAANALIEKCGRYPQFQAGATLHARFIGRDRGTPIRVNIEVDVGHEIVADRDYGRTLLYMVTLDRKGRPVSVSTGHGLSAMVCGSIHDTGIDVPLP